MPKLPAIGTIISEAYSTLKRFPGVLICAIIGACALTYYTDYSGIPEYTWVIYLIFTCALGAVFFLSAYLFFERNRISIRDKWVYSILIVVALVVYYLLQPDELNRITAVRFVLFNLALHLLVPFAAFIRFNEPNGFWHFNQQLFIRLFVSLFYSIVLFAGTALALTTIEYLFNVDFDSDVYLKAFYLIFIVFNAWIFLNGIPKNIEELEQDNSYPKFLKLFAQFVLIPLVAVYIVILYAYVIRLFVIGSGPDTNVAYMVLALAIAGILALLLVWPLAKQEKYLWLRIYTRVFYIILIPLIILFFVAIWHRLRDYGITENRYFILVLALWLFGVAVYFIFHKQNNIKLIPASLCVVTFLASFGPWGAINFSRVSQLTRFETILTNNDLLEEGKVVKAGKKLEAEEAEQLLSVTNYLTDVFGVKVLQPFFHENLDSLSNSDEYKDNYNSYIIFDLLKLPTPIPRQIIDGYAHFYYSINANNEISTKGYDKLYSTSLNLESKSESTFAYEGRELKLQLEKEPSILTVSIDGAKDVAFNLDSVVINLNEIGIEQRDSLNPDLLSVLSTGIELRYNLILNRVEGRIMNNEISDIYFFDIKLLVGKLD